MTGTDNFYRPRYLTSASRATNRRKSPRKKLAWIALVLIIALIIALASPSQA